MSILQEIVAYKKKELLKRKKRHSLTFLKDNIILSKHSFFKALEGRQKTSLIAEIKYQSPSKGIIKQQTINNLLETISYYNAYASAISVLTDTNFFGGSFQNLEIARQNSHLPLLCKDFIIDPYQIHEARYYGANAILLIAAILNKKELSFFYQIAQDLNMDCLFEVHTEKELNTVLEINPKIIGINIRNLHNFSFDQELFFKLSQKIPTDKIIIAESGINTKQDVHRIQNYANAMLVGTSLMKSNNMLVQLAELTQNTKIKICGLTNIKDAVNAAKYGASYLGFIFANSKRQITTQKCLSIIQEIKQRFPTIKTVGVFQDQDISQIINISKISNIDIIQLHGEEDNIFVNHIKTSIKKEVWQTIHISHNKTEFIADLIRTNYADKILLDTEINGQKGGSGVSFKWDKITGINKQIDKEIILAGGINPQNIVTAKQYANILDIGSGVESSPGNKSESKIKNIFLNLKNK